VEWCWSWCAKMFANISRPERILSSKFQLSGKFDWISMAKFVSVNNFFLTSMHPRLTCCFAILSRNFFLSIYELYSLFWVGIVSFLIEESAPRPHQCLFRIRIPLNALDCAFSCAKPFQLGKLISSVTLMHCPVGSHWITSRFQCCQGTLISAGKHKRGRKKLCGDGKIWGRTLWGAELFRQRPKFLVDLAEKFSQELPTLVASELVEELFV
jgi:hypothetical protein